MLKVVIDTNVFISGIVFGGTPRKIIDAWLTKQYVFCLSPELKAEILIKLEKKFSLPQEAMNKIKEALDTYSQKYIPTQKVTLCKDPQDNFLLELADETKADYLVSGDKLVLALKEYKNTKIISPREFFDQILA
jgi:putative PIN family toxin of toxin-antitoxin system